MDCVVTAWLLRTARSRRSATLGISSARIARVVRAQQTAQADRTARTIASAKHGATTGVADLTSGLLMA